jgi:hypothetical protein
LLRRQPLNAPDLAGERRLAVLERLRLVSPSGTHKDARVGKERNAPIRGAETIIMDYMRAEIYSIGCAMGAAQCSVGEHA